MRSIAMNNLRNVDLNLLVTLDALLTERSVTRAAQRLHLSQPSVSVQLRKLRQIFADPLLAPGPGGLSPTTKAHALAQPLRAVLAEMAELLQPRRRFDPAEAVVTWQIAAGDYAEYAILLPLLTRLRQAAPRTRLAIQDANHARMQKQLESGAIDLALMAVDFAPERSHHQVLFKERYVLVGGKGHPALKRKLTLDEFCRLEFVLVSPDGGGFRGITDTMLEGRGRTRRVALSVPHFLFVPEALAHTDLVAMMPSRLMRGRRGRLQIVDPPLPIPAFEMAMVWHERAHADPAHMWLRDQLQRLCRTAIGRKQTILT